MEKTKKTVISSPVPLFLSELFDKMYYCVFRFVMQSPSRDMPYVVSAATMTLIIGSNTVLLLAAIKVCGNIQIATSNANRVIELIGVLLFSFTFYYYVLKKNGERIVKHYTGQMSERKSVVIGYILFFEAVLLPFFIIITRLILNKTMLG